ncbi:MAG: amidohydrolase, partial [Bacteroidota bacterium]
MKKWIYTILFACCFQLLGAQVKDAPDRRADEGEGPFNQLIIRGITLINGNSAPPRGPIDIVVENNIIKQISV